MRRYENESPRLTRFETTTISVLGLVILGSLFVTLLRVGFSVSDWTISDDKFLLKRTRGGNWVEVKERTYWEAIASYVAGRLAFACFWIYILYKSVVWKFCTKR